MTAVRWANLLRALGHRLTIGVEYHGEPCDVMVALHARKSATAIGRYRRLFPSAPLVVALTGTDLYRDIRTSRRAQRSLERADRLVLLQSQGVHELAPRLRPKCRVIYQSAVALPNPPGKRENAFEVCVLGHLRHEKDPLRAALALRQLPGSSPVRVLHAGEALSRGWAARARAAMRRDARYRWLGELPRAQARRLLARSRLLVLSSRMEGGANVISEAVVEGVPVLASRISGSVGLLGEHYPGYYPIGDTEALARLLNRASTDAGFLGKLRKACDALKPRFEPARERAAWASLLEELVAPKIPPTRGGAPL